MRIAGEYSFNGGSTVIGTQFPAELAEVKKLVASINSEQCKTKISREKTMPGRKLYSPRALNKAFKTAFAGQNWVTHRI